MTSITDFGESPRRIELMSEIEELSPRDIRRHLYALGIRIEQGKGTINDIALYKALRTAATAIADFQGGLALQSDMTQLREERGIDCG